MSSYIMMMASAPVSFKAGFQTLTAMWTMDAGMVATALAMNDMFCSNAMTEMEFKGNFKIVQLFIDNTSTLSSWEQDLQCSHNVRGPAVLLHP